MNIILNGTARLDYAYDANGNITSIKDAAGTTTYQYDELNQLIREDNHVLDKTLTYTYDLGGNLTHVKEYAFTTGALPASPLKTETGIYDTNWKDKLLSWNGTEMTYDAIGNMLTKGNTTYTWTQGRKLSGVNNGKSIQYFYDHTGMRTKKLVDGALTEYRMVGSLLVSEKRPTVTLWYSYDSSANLISLTINGVDYFYIRNAQNDIIGLVDAAGTVVVNYEYDSWGNIISITGSKASTVGQQNPFRYRGYYYDTETGMYYLQSRYYDPEIRRFINADNVELLISTPEALINKNLYAYCDNNPIIRKDKGGAFWETVLDVISLGASVGDVAMNVTDPWAWAGLAGDTLDLIPFVTGAGELTRAIKVTNKIDTVTDTAKTAKKVDYYVTPLGDAIPATRKGFDNNLSKLENKNGKYYGNDSKGPVRIRVEKHDPTPGYKGPDNPYHTNPHFHIDRREKEKTGPFRKIFTGLMRWLR